MAIIFLHSYRLLLYQGLLWDNYYFFVQTGTIIIYLLFFLHFFLNSIILFHPPLLPLSSPPPLSFFESWCTLYFFIHSCMATLSKTSPKVRYIPITVLDYRFDFPNQSTAESVSYWNLNFRPPLIMCLMALNALFADSTCWIPSCPIFYLAVSFSFLMNESRLWSVKSAKLLSDGTPIIFSDGVLYQLLLTITPVLHMFHRNFVVAHRISLNSDVLTTLIWIWSLFVLV